MRAAAILVSAGLALGLFVYGGRQFALRKAERAMFRTQRQGPRTPGSVGLAFETPRIESGGRRLKSFYVAAQDETAPALLLFHGNGESISNWVSVLALLHEEGIAAMVF